MNKYLKFVAAAIIIALGIYLMFNRNIGWGIVLVVLSGIPIALFFKNENILLAFWQLRKQNMDKAAKFLANITDYKSQLHKSQYGYFHYLQALTTAQDNPAKTEELMTEFHAISQKMYEQSSEGADATEGASESANDDVVDADYEVVDDEDDK